MKTLKDQLNFTTTRSTEKGLTWGATIGPDPSNASHWNGIVGLLATGKADISSVGLTMSRERALVSKKMIEMPKTLL